MIVTVTEFAEVGLHAAASQKLNSDITSIHHHTFIDEMHWTGWPCIGVDSLQRIINKCEVIGLMYKTEI